MNLVEFDDDITNPDIDPSEDTVVQLLPHDYKRCKTCNFDHKYETEDAIAIHYRLARDRN